MPQSVFKFSSWLGTFLQRRGLQAPDCRGLYAYHCSHEEYLDLLHQLRELHMAKVVETAKVQNSEQKWSTDVLVELVGK